METSEMSLLSQALQTAKNTEKLLKMLKDSGISANDLKYNWNINARPKQLLTYDKNWITTLALAGRGFGKTRLLSEFIRQEVYQNGKKHIGLIAATASDCRDTLVLGTSGILACCPKHERPIYQSSKAKLIFPNGAVMKMYSAEKADRLRGGNFDTLAMDELAAWQNVDDTYDMAMMGLRLGDYPRCVIATTPRPIKLIKDLVQDKLTIKIRGGTLENRSNLADQFINTIIKRYQGTRLGNQEILGEILDDNPNALFNLDNISANRKEKAPEMHTIVVAVDPAVTSKLTSDDTGIIVCGVSGKGASRQYYILADYTCHKSPDQWAREAVKAYHDYNANLIVAEVNQGGDLIKALIKTIDSSISVKNVRASRGKLVRAEPISALYEQDKVHHVGIFNKLEDEMTSYSADLGESSPDRLDALVWGLTKLSKGGGGRCSSY